MFELMDTYSQSAVIKVLGVGGGGGNAVSHMVQAGLEGETVQHVRALRPTAVAQPSPTIAAL